MLDLLPCAACGRAVENHGHQSAMDCLGELSSKEEAASNE